MVTVENRRFCAEVVFGFPSLQVQLFWSGLEGSNTPDTEADRDQTCKPSLNLKKAITFNFLKYRKNSIDPINTGLFGPL